MKKKFQAFLTVALLAISFFTVLPDLSASAAVTPGNAALNWAETQHGVPYVYGGTGPWGYDCSGIVYEAFLHIGINISRDTYSQLASWGNGHFHQVSWGQERRGDIAFYGTGHEELVTGWWHTTYGAQQPGTVVWWHQWSGWWQPTLFVRVW